ncbi:MAG: LysR family transcriptional regulator [Spirochaetaceae bacterium]|jgi:lysyl-tRNA synthetase class 2|nr:LysR family transcriptional regulator [Spirochaetaceae bacterium]
MDIAMLKARHAILKRIRAFFDSRGYLELDTPLLSPSLIPETCLEVFKTEFISAKSSVSPKELYLIPSPEIWMKKIIAKERVNVYQICKCFRNCESQGRNHSPEFTMLEYYTMNASCFDSLALAESLFETLINDIALDGFLDTEAKTALIPPFTRLTMDEAFSRYAGFSLNAAIVEGSLRERGRALGLEAGGDTSDADWYNLIFIHAVEPCLRDARPVALTDYPVLTPCLAALNTDAETSGAPTYQRWELYARGLELANCYTEEREPGKVKQYFEREGALKIKNARIKHSIDEEFLKIFKEFNKKNENFSENSAFPRCSGAAFGLDRLIMVLTGRQDISLTQPFSVI